MTRRQHCRILSVVLFGLLALACGVQPARADGGTVRLSERIDGYQVTVFTAPTPFRAGPVDISVLVQDAVTGKPLTDVEVTVWLARLDQPETRISHVATNQAATNKLLHAAKFELPASGCWQVEIQVKGAQGPIQAQFQLEAGEPLPRWAEMGFWISLPAVVVVLFGIHQVLVRRKTE